MNGSNGEIINNINSNSKYENGITTNEMLINSQQQQPNTPTSNGKYDSQSSLNSSSSSSSTASSRSSPTTQNPSIAVSSNGNSSGEHQFKPSPSGNTPIFNNNQNLQQQPAFTPINNPQNGGPNGGEFVPVNGSYIHHHPNAAFIPTTSHMAMFNNNSSHPQYVSNNTNNNSNNNSSANHSDMKHAHHQQQNHPTTNFFYNGMVPCSSDRGMSAVPMGYPPVTCSASDMAFLAAGLNNMMTVQPSYQYMMAGPPNMPFIPVTTAPTTMDFNNNNNNKPVVVENHDAVNFTPMSSPQSGAMMHHNNAQPPQSTFQHQPNKMSLGNNGSAGKSNVVVDTAPVGQQPQQPHAVESGNSTGNNNSNVGLKAQNFVFMSTAPGKVNRVVVH